MPKASQDISGGFLWNGLGMDWEWTKNENIKFIQFLHFIISSSLHSPTYSGNSGWIPDSSQSVL